MQQLSPLASIRKTPEVILWALAVFVCGVVVLPLVHLVGHEADHEHGTLAAHLQAHAAGEAHGDGPGHGAGDAAHFGLALLEVTPPALLPPEMRRGADVGPVAPLPPLVGSRWTPIRPGAP
jgi:hypothetical protein